MRRSWKLSHISWVVRRIFEFSGDGGGGGLFSVISQCKLCSCSPPTSAHGQYMYGTCNCQKCALYPIYIVHSDDTCIYNWHLNYLASVMMTFQFSNNIFVMNIIYTHIYRICISKPSDSEKKFDLFVHHWSFISNKLNTT